MEILHQKNDNSSQECIIFEGEVFFYKNEGKTRKVFANEDKTFVIKVPIGVYGVLCNSEEAKFYSEGGKDVKDGFAFTELSGVFVKQEYLHTLDDEETYKWIGRPLTFSELRLATSCRNEVGFDENKKLKCYDYDEFKKQD